MTSLLPSSWEVPALFRSRLGERAGRQRIMTAEGHLLIILHKPPQPGEAEREAAFFWRNPKGEWRSSERGSGIGALMAHFDRLGEVVDHFEGQMDQEASAENFFSIVQGATPLLRTVRNTHRTMQEAREAVPEDRTILLARDTAGDLERAVELLHNDAQHGMEFMIAKQGEEQARRSHQLVTAGQRLNLLIALFLPLTAIGSVFGMNLLHGLEEWKAPWPFWILLFAGLLTGLALLLALTFKREFGSREDGDFDDGDLAGKTPPPSLTVKPAISVSTKTTAENQTAEPPVTGR